MPTAGPPGSPVLIVDDEPAVHDDFRRCLVPAANESARLGELRRDLFGVESPAPPESIDVELFHADSGEAAVEMLRARLSQSSGFALAFVDMRMSPGWNGVETIRALWELDPHIQMVLCTAFSDFTWDRVLAEVGNGERLHLLRKPFSTDQVRRFTQVLCKKWQLAKGGGPRLGRTG